MTDQPLSVAVIGFSPGFAYLDGLPDALRAVPRRKSPRPVVPAGSVALANGHAAVYPVSSPGGWRLVGRTGFPLFSLAGPPYASLSPGDVVHFCVAGDDDPLEPAPFALPTSVPRRGSRPVMETEVPGWRCVLQDGGRRGVAAIGVPSARAADPDSYTLANRLVGNADVAGALEITVGGARLRTLGPCHVAVVGGGVGIGVDGTPAPSDQVLPLTPGQVLQIDPMTRGVRCYLSVAGGVVGPAVFGSCATDELSGIGPGPLTRAGPPRRTVAPSARRPSGARGPTRGRRPAAGSSPCASSRVHIPSGSGPTLWSAWPGSASWSETIRTESGSICTPRVADPLRDCAPTGPSSIRMAW